jgi:hypothetical protein
MIKLTTRHGQLTKTAATALREALQRSADDQAYAETNGRQYGEDAWGYLVRGGRLCMIDGTHAGSYALRAWR